MKYINFVCPVCDGFEFTKPLPGEEDDIRQCHICGWVYNEDEMEHPEKLDKYRKAFQEHRKEDPQWNWLAANAPDPILHKCPVCGKYEFEDEDSHDICPYCGWEDDSVQTDDPNCSGGANDLCLNDYKKQYQELLTRNPDYIWKKDIGKI